MNSSARMWPQPNRLLSTTLICACWPTNSLTFHDAQSSFSLSLPVAVRTTLSVDHQVHGFLIGPGNSGRVGEHDMVKGQVSPPAGSLVNDPQLCILSREFGDVPALPVQDPGIVSGQGSGPRCR